MDTTFSPIELATFAGLVLLVFLAGLTPRLVLRRLTLILSSVNTGRMPWQSSRAFRPVERTHYTAKCSDCPTRSMARGWDRVRRKEA